MVYGFVLNSVHLRKYSFSMKDLPAKELQKLLNLIALGDNKAVETIYRHYQASVYAFIRLRVRDDQAAEEILNDTFMIAIQKPAQYNGTSEFKTWLCGIAKNVCGTWMRKQNSGLARSIVEINEEVFDNLPSPDWDIVSRLESQEMDDVLRECIDQLPVTHKEAFFWTWFEEEPMEIVAERLECPLGTIKSRLFNARAKIADCVKGVFESEPAYV
ncbi:MAG: hypothetical protein RL651_799 [Pseudomonadota bacterium]